MKRIVFLLLVFLLTFSMVFTVSAAETGNGEMILDPVEFECESHEDADNDGRCDICDELLWYTETTTKTTTENRNGWVIVYETVTANYYYPDGTKFDTKTEGPTEVDRYQLAASSFYDLKAGAWYIPGIDYVLKNSMMVGTGVREFSPDTAVSRAMVATVLHRMCGAPVPKKSNQFTDVPNGQWYSDAVNWMAENYIVAGYGNGKFGPNDPITREQLVTILFTYSDYCKYNLTVRSSIAYDYTDGRKTADYAFIPMQWAVGSGLVSGTSSTTLSPKATATRAQLAAVLQRFAEWMKAEDTLCNHWYVAYYDKVTGEATTIDRNGLRYNGVVPTATSSGYEVKTCERCQNSSYKEFYPNNHALTLSEVAWVAQQCERRAERSGVAVKSFGNQAYNSIADAGSGFNVMSQISSQFWYTKEAFLEYQLKPIVDYYIELALQYPKGCYVFGCPIVKTGANYTVYITY